MDPGDSLEKVVGIMQTSRMPALPVVQEGRIVGIVTEQSVLARLNAGSADSATVGELMDRNPPCANVYMTISQVAEMMQTTGAEALPAIDEFGTYHGLALRSDVLAAMLNVSRPPSIAGMATPLGVRLTTGSVTAGAGNFGLFLAGAALMVLMEAARGTLFLLTWLIDGILHTHLMPMLLSISTGTMIGLDAVHYVFTIAQMVLMLLFLRFSPMSSYHAAEHQVVHTIEEGEPLTPENVSKMPRAHPRCGTNLMAGIVLLSIVMSGLGPGVASQLITLVFILIIIMGWRTVGYYMQQYFTTKPAGEKYIRNGIAVGEELLEKYRMQPNRPMNTLSRIWGMGLPQVFLGFAAVIIIDQYITKLLKLPGLF
jgi:CBS domain-containing protein